MKDTVWAPSGVIAKAICSSQSDKKITYRDLGPELLYAPLVRHETFQLLIVKWAAQDLIVKGPDFDNSYLYVDIKDEMSTLLKHSTDTSGIPARY